MFLRRLIIVSKQKSLLALVTAMTIYIVWINKRILTEPIDILKSVPINHNFFLSSSEEPESDRLEIQLDPNSPKIRFPWASSENERCRNLNISLAINNTMPKVVLLSYPGSGNTWLRFLVESITGVFTSSIYTDGTLAKVLLGETVDFNAGSTLGVKAHRLMGKKFNFTDVILLVRNPIEAAIAYFHWRYSSGDHHTQSTGISLNSSLFYDFVEAGNGCPMWLLVQRSVLPLDERVHIMHYEMLKQDLRSEMLKLANFLNFTIDPLRLQCLMEQSEGSFHRPPSNIEDYPLTKNRTEMFENAICDVHQDFINFYNGNGLPLDLYKQSIEKRFKEVTANRPLPNFTCPKSILRP